MPRTRSRTRQDEHEIVARAAEWTVTPTPKPSLVFDKRLLLPVCERVIVESQSVTLLDKLLSSETHTESRPRCQTCCARRPGCTCPSARP